MVDNLLKLGFRVDAGAVLAAADGKPPTGELIAEVMLSDANCHTPPLRPYKMCIRDRSEFSFFGD